MYAALGNDITGSARGKVRLAHRPAHHATPRPQARLSRLARSWETAPTQRQRTPRERNPAAHRTPSVRCYLSGFKAPGGRQ
jgi:hypothetical protein